MMAGQSFRELSTCDDTTNQVRVPSGYAVAGGHVDAPWNPETCQPRGFVKSVHVTMPSKHPSADLDMATSAVLVVILGFTD